MKREGESKRRAGSMVLAVELKAPDSIEDVDIEV